jgi:glycosyltransferase involved in cell wall biosynthesis
MDYDLDYMNYPTVTVIIPVYNAASTIQKCLDSVLCQTVKVLEIIVINDGSTDNTDLVIQEFKEENNLKNLFVIFQENSGPARARNGGIKVARGEWIAFLDADDRWLPNKIAKQFEAMEKISNCFILGTGIFSNDQKMNGLKIYEVTFFGLLFVNRFITSSVIVSKEIITQFSFDESKKYSEDYKLWLQIIRFYKGIILKEGLIIYSDNQKIFKRKSLSNDLWRMEKGELDNFIYLYKVRAINLPILIIILMYSFLKFIRRYIIAILCR